MPQSPPVVLTIAGFDPSSGAGVTADIKTIAAHGCYGISCITALTVQSTTGVRRVEPVNPQTATETLNELALDFKISAAKIGMLGSAKVVQAVADFLKERQIEHVVLDPILKSSSGTALVDAEGVRLMIEQLLPLCGVITPNTDEAGMLARATVSNEGQMKAAAATLHQMGASNVVITGGHLDKAIDLLSFRNSKGNIEQEIFKAERRRSKSTHGTGCAFSAAVACHLALGRGLPEAVLLAKAYVTAAITNGQPLGRGVGPLHHLYRMHEQPRRAARVGEPDPVSR